MNDMGPLPVEHPRESFMRKAKVDLDVLLTEFYQRGKFTKAEWLSLLVGVLKDDLDWCVTKERSEAT